MSRRILLVARTYPPLVGGMEQYAHDLHRHLEAMAPVTLLANRVGKKVLAKFFLQVAWHLMRHGRGYTHIHFADGVTAPLIPLAHLLSRAKVSITIHALDITYNRFGYQRLVARFVRRADQVVCVSANTMRECEQRSVPAQRCLIIPNGIDFAQLPREPIDLPQHVERFLAGRKMLFSIGRLIERKGLAWFVRHVLPRLSADYALVIAGDGPQRLAIEQAIDDTSQDDRVLMLGRVVGAMKHALYQHAHWFVMPNISVTGDAEGFGITLIEAAAHGLPSVASAIEGIPDAVVQGRTGYLVPSHDAEAFVAKLSGPPLDRALVRQTAQERYDWQMLARRYVQEVFALEQQKL